MKKIAYSLVAATMLLGSNAVASDVDMKAELEALKKELMDLKKVVNGANLQGMREELGAIKSATGGDNIKWDVDYRTTFDRIEYKFADGHTSSNDDLLTNRLILGGKYAPRDDLSFLMKLSYNKAYGDSANHGQSNTGNALGSNYYADFDWVTNENATDNSLKVKEAYFIYFGNVTDNMPFTASIGRRPSTGGLPTNLREGDAPNSPLGHGINVEFDGLSAMFNLEKVTGVSGMYWKLCTGRGLTDAKPRFDLGFDNYAKDDSLHDDIDMIGFIFQPYYDGQYRMMTSFYWAQNLIGFDMSSYQNTFGQYLQGAATYNQVLSAYNGVLTNGFQDVGNYHGGSVLLMAEGIGDFWTDFLDETTLFASWSYSQTDPDAGSLGRMLGTNEQKFGSSWYAGMQIPGFVTSDARLGFEWNVGSQYWRSFTYGEDTMIGSKLAARGTAWEVYYLQPLLGKTLTMDVRYTSIDYDYTGSNGFFGDEGTPYKISDLAASSQSSYIETADDFRVAIRYRY